MQNRLALRRGILHMDVIGMLLRPAILFRKCSGFSELTWIEKY